MSHRKGQKKLSSMFQRGLGLITFVHYYDHMTGVSARDKCRWECKTCARHG